MREIHSQYRDCRYESLVSLGNSPPSMREFRRQILERGRMLRPKPNATQKLELETKLTETGWKIVSRKIDDLDWWADEQWIIESDWAPHGFRLFLTDRVDPQHTGPRPKGVAVWSIVATTEPPVRWQVEGPSMRLNRGWRKDLPGFLEGLAELRDRSLTCDDE